MDSRIVIHLQRLLYAAAIVILGITRAFSADPQSVVDPELRTLLKKAANETALDGLRANQWRLVRSQEDLKLSPEQRQQRDALELEIAQLRQQKNALSEDDYYRKLEALLTKLGEIEVGDAK